MIISSYSALMALVWFVVFLSVGDFFRRKTGLLSHYNFYVLLIFIGLSVVRLILPVELPITAVIRSEHILTTVKSIFCTQFINIGIVHISLINILVLIWCAGAAFSIFKLCLRLKRDRAILKSICLLGNETVSKCLNEIVSESASRLKPRIFISPDISSPMAIGIFRPTILIPQSELDSEYIQLQIAHEWQHIMNNDQSVKLLINIISCVMWWLRAARRLRDSVEDALEIRCDLKTTKNMSDAEKAKYLKALILGYDRAYQEENSKNFFAMSSRLTSSRSTEEAVKERLSIIRKHKTGMRGSMAAFCVAACAVFVLSFMFVFQPFYPPSIDNYDENEIANITLTADNSYIVISDGQISVYLNNNYAFDISADLLDEMPYRQFKVIKN